MPKVRANPRSVVGAGPFDLSAKDLFDFNAGYTFSAATAQTAVQAQLEIGIRQATAYVKRKVKESISRPNPDGTNPSNPGEPPKRVTGHLRNSISSRVETLTTGDVAGFVGTDVEYAQDLEFGNPDENLAKRPFLRPAVLNNQAEVNRLIAGAF